MRDGEIYAALSDKLQLKELAAKDAEIERLRAALGKFKELYCEGYCEVDDGIYIHDCGGCDARVALKSK